jgi:uncharacterized protein
MAQEEILHSFEIQAEPGVVWTFLWDIEGMARCIPGCQSVAAKTPDRSYNAVVRKKVGPFLVRMELAIEVLAQDAPNSILVEISGDDLKLKSHIRQLVDIRLSQGRDGGTAVAIHATLIMDGILASLGRPLIEMQVRQVLNDFSEAFQAKMQDAKVL